MGSVSLAAEVKNRNGAARGVSGRIQMSAGCFCSYSWYARYFPSTDSETGTCATVCDSVSCSGSTAAVGAGTASCPPAARYRR